MDQKRSKSRVKHSRTDQIRREDKLVGLYGIALQLTHRQIENVDGGRRADSIIVRSGLLDATMESPHTRGLLMRFFSLYLGFPTLGL